MKQTIQIGTRSSPLALLQTDGVRQRLKETVPAIDWVVAKYASPGDRDKQADLLSASPDFFTRDLDEALLKGELDCAVHSAKDLPDPLPVGIDWVCLPNPADPRDVLVHSREIPLAEAQSLSIGEGCSLRTLRLCEDSEKIVQVDPKRVGVSSERRIAYAKQRFPDAEYKPLRGTIEARIAQLDAGDFDVIIMAAAALQRLGLEERISEWISLEDLLVSAGQGVLALTFRTGDERFLRLRSLWVRPVVFVGAGASAGLCTQAGIRALKRADVCLYDALIDPSLLKECPASTQRIYVGKQFGKHSHTQPEICELLTRLARQGKRVVRLKGGDAGLYGRLAEEVEALDALRLPSRVIPGVSSLATATTGTGLLLTRRGVADRVQILSGHSAVEGAVRETTEVVFMGTRKLAELAQERIDAGASPETPVAVVFSAGLPEEKIIFGTLGTSDGLVDAETGPPGLILFGPAAHSQYQYRSFGALHGMRVWLTCSDAVQERAAQAVLDFGGIPIQRPVIELKPEAFPVLGAVDWLILTSPSTVRILLPQMKDLRRLPKILCCGQGTANALKRFQLTPDAMPEGEFNTEGLLQTALEEIPRNAKILRLRSDLAGPVLVEKFRKHFESVEDFVLCSNHRVTCEAPEFDAIFFASVSAIHSYVEQFGVPSLNGKTVVTIGPKDTEAILKAGWVGTPVAPVRATVEEAVEALAAFEVRERFN